MRTSVPQKGLCVVTLLAKRKPSYSLYEDKLLVLFSFSNDLFEPSSMFKPIGCDENMFQIREEIESILQNVDLLLERKQQTRKRNLNVLPQNRILLYRQAHQP